MPKNSVTSKPITPEPADLRALPDTDYHFGLGITAGSAAEFFAPTADNAALLAERQHWLDDAPERYVALLEAGHAVVFELRHLQREGFRTTNEPPRPQTGVSSSLDCKENAASALRELGQTLEPDFVLLARMAEHEPLRVVGGSVCFPSSWSLPEKLGLTVEAVHEVVPGLNGASGVTIDRLLDRMKPGHCVLRSNWGLCLSPELNQHPDRHLPRLNADTNLDSIWLRREHQALLRLPESDAIVFGIRVEHRAVSTLLSVPELARRLHRGLATMSPAMRDYKAITAITPRLLAALGGASAG